MNKFLSIHIFALERELEPCLGFGGFRLRITQLAAKGSFISPLSPCLSKVRTYRTG